jgi:hypothetical protein
MRGDGGGRRGVLLGQDYDYKRVQGDVDICDV